MKITKAICKELTNLQTSKGLLRPVDVVKAAESTASAMHNCFTWDDTAAAHQHRLWQARELIVRVSVKIEGTEESAQAYVSLTCDRQGKGGGYRTLVGVLSDTELKKHLLKQFWQDWKLFERRYKQLQELSVLFRTAKKLKAS